MALPADFAVKLRRVRSAGQLTADISGVLDTLAGIDLPLDPEAVEGIVSVAGSVDLANLNVRAEALGKQILEVGATCRSPAICSAPSSASSRSPNGSPSPTWRPPSPA